MWGQPPRTQGEHSRLLPEYEGQRDPRRDGDSARHDRDRRLHTLLQTPHVHRATFAATVTRGLSEQLVQQGFHRQPFGKRVPMRTMRAGDNVVGV